MGHLADRKALENVMGSHTFDKQIVVRTVGEPEQAKCKPEGNAGQRTPDPSTQADGNAEDQAAEPNDGSIDSAPPASTPSTETNHSCTGTILMLAAGGAVGLATMRYLK